MTFDNFVEGGSVAVILSFKFERCKNGADMRNRSIKLNLVCLRQLNQINYISPVQEYVNKCAVSLEWNAMFQLLINN